MLRPGDAEILSFLEQIQLARHLSVGLRCYRLRTMCLNLARWLKLDQEQIRQLIFLSYCHGLGKIGIPDSILLKPSALNEQEWVKIREYPEVSELICNQLPVLREFAPLVRSHQERLNGMGYPDGLPLRCSGFPACEYSGCDYQQATASRQPLSPKRSPLLGAGDRGNY
jgi:response regulator RpfG family c-di-GMP phosphodiesterase